MARCKGTSGVPADRTPLIGRRDAVLDRSTACAPASPLSLHLTKCGQLFG
jgi:hypothetical protein